MRKIIIHEVDAEIQVKEPVVDSTPESAPANESKQVKKKAVSKNEKTSSS